MNQNLLKEGIDIFKKRGRECHFIVKQMDGKPNAAIITYNMYEHEDKDGWPCHGQSDRSNEPRVMYVPHFSREMVL